MIEELNARQRGLLLTISSISISCHVVHLRADIHLRTWLHCQIATEKRRLFQWRSSNFWDCLQQPLCYILQQLLHMITTFKTCQIYQQLQINITAFKACFLTYFSCFLYVRYADDELYDLSPISISLLQL